MTQSQIKESVKKIKKALDNPSLSDSQREKLENQLDELEILAEEGGFNYTARKKKSGSRDIVMLDERKLAQLMASRTTPKVKQEVMNTQEILTKIEKLKNAIQSESDPDVK